MNNQEATVHFEGKEWTASEWLKLVCDRNRVAAVFVQATGDQRYNAYDENCQHCGGPYGEEVDILQGKLQAIVHLHPECEAAYRAYWGDKIIISSREGGHPGGGLAPDIRTVWVTTAVTPPEVAKKMRQAIDELKAPTPSKEALIRSEWPDAGVETMTEKLMDRLRATIEHRADIAMRWHKLKTLDEVTAFVHDDPDMVEWYERPEVQREIWLDTIKRIIEPGADLDAARKALGHELVDAILAASERWKQENGEVAD